MKVNYIKLSPAKNSTILVTSNIKSNVFSLVGKKIMSEESVFAEQVGFITQPKDNKNVVRLEMAGGEFCGNAILATAAYYEFINLNNKKNFNIESSGIQSSVECSVEKIDLTNFYVSAIMPKPYLMTKKDVFLNEKTINGYLIELNGITHFITNFHLKDYEWNEILNYLKHSIEAKAIGIMNIKHEKDNIYYMTPLVYVKENNSSFFEHSCGSGSIALGYFLSQTTQKKEFYIRQPGGEIKVTVNEKIQISTNVYITCEGIAYINNYDLTKY